MQYASEAFCQYVTKLITWIFFIFRDLIWCYTKKADKKGKTRYNRRKHREEKEMPRKKSTHYTEEFKKTIVNLHQNGKSYAEIEQEYGVSHSASSWS